MHGGNIDQEPDNWDSWVNNFEIIAEVEIQYADNDNTEGYVDATTTEIADSDVEKANIQNDATSESNSKNDYLYSSNDESTGNETDNNTSIHEDNLHKEENDGTHQNREENREIHSVGTCSRKRKLEKYLRRNIYGEILVKHTRR